MERKRSRAAQMLLDARMRMNLSQTKLANLAGISQAEYQRLEVGARSVGGCSAKIILNICWVLSIDPFVLVFGRNNVDESSEAIS